MTNKTLAAAAAVAMLAAGVGAGWAVSRHGSDEARLLALENDARTAKSEAVALAAEVARLRETLGEDVTAGPGDSPVRSERPRPVPHAARIARLEKSVADLSSHPGAAPADDAARRGREALAQLLQITDPEKGRTIRDLVERLVKAGDAAVPDIVAALNSGLEHDFSANHQFAMSAGSLRSWGGTRMALFDALRQIETPAADAAFLDAVGQSRRLSDYRDLLWLYPSTKNAVVVERLSALVPDMLRKAIDVGGLDKVEKLASGFATELSTFLHAHEFPGMADLIEELLVKAPAVDGTPGGAPSYDHARYFQLLTTLAPERAARVALACQERDPSGGAVHVWTDWIGRPSYGRLIPYYETLLARGQFDARVRRELFAGMPTAGLATEIQDPTKRVEDAAAFVVFLEGRLAAEPDAEARTELSSRLDELREAIERARKQR